MNTKINEKELSTFMLSNTSDAPSTGSTLPKKQSLESQMDPLDIMRVGLKLKGSNSFGIYTYRK